MGLPAAEALLEFFRKQEEFSTIAKL